MFLLLATLQEMGGLPLVCQLPLGPAAWGQLSEATADTLVNVSNNKIRSCKFAGWHATYIFPVWIGRTARIDYDSDIMKEV